MSDPSLELQKAVLDTLRGNAGVVAVVAQRIYDTVPAEPQFPYVTLGDAQVQPDKADCIDGAESFLQIDAWSRAIGYPEVKSLGKAIVAAIDEAELTLSTHRTILCDLQDLRYLRDPDGLTRHGVFTFRVLTELT